MRCSGIRLQHSARAFFDDPAFFGDIWAGIYDDPGRIDDPAAAVEFLAGLAGDGRVLELAIGTDRVALPLAGRGIAVEGVDARRRWWNGRGPGRAASRSPSPSVIWPTYR